MIAIFKFYYEYITYLQTVMFRILNPIEIIFQIKRFLLDALICQFVHNGKKKHISPQEQVLNAAAQTYTYTCNKDNQIRILYVKGSSNDTYCLCSL